MSSPPGGLDTDKIKTYTFKQPCTNKNLSAYCINVIVVGKSLEEAELMLDHTLKTHEPSAINPEYSDHECYYRGHEEEWTDKYLAVSQEEYDMSKHWAALEQYKQAKDHGVLNSLCEDVSKVDAADKKSVIVGTRQPLDLHTLSVALAKKTLRVFTLKQENSKAEMITVAETEDEALQLAKYDTHFSSSASKLSICSFEIYNEKLHKPLFKHYLEDRYRYYLDNGPASPSKPIVKSPASHDLAGDMKRVSPGDEYMIFTIGSTIPLGCEGIFQVIATSKEEALQRARKIRGFDAFSKGYCVISQRKYNEECDKHFLEEHLKSVEKGDVDVIGVDLPSMLKGILGFNGS